MNKPGFSSNKGIVIAVVAALALGLGGFGLYKMSADKKTEVGVEVADNIEATPQKSLRDLFSSGLTQKCSFEGGEVFISSGKVRTDMQANHVLVDGDTAYIWQDGQTQGMKMKFDLSTAGAVDSDTSANTKVDWDRPAEYKCGPWVSDASKFALPSTVTFSDFSINVSPSGASDSSNCNVCDALTGANKTACLSAMGCN